MNLQADAVLQIQQAVAAALDELPVHQRWWVRAHLIVPRHIQLCTDPDCGKLSTFWLITDHVGTEDAPFRIVYDGESFGLAMTLEDGVTYLAHRTASLGEAVDCL